MHNALLQLIAVDLRYWVLEYVDGFRFDLTSTLARQFHEVDRLSSFFHLIQQDRYSAKLKHAEPWDIGEGNIRPAASPHL
jgi:glycogen operon protein